MIDPVAIGLAGQTEQKNELKSGKEERKNPDMNRLNVTSAAARITE